MKRQRSLSGSNRRGQSLSMTTSRNRLTSSRRGQQSVIQMTTLPPMEFIGLPRSERATPVEQETTTSIFHNGHEQKI